MATMSIAIAGVQILAGSSQVRRVGLKSQSPLINFPVNANPYYSRLKPIIGFNNARVSTGVANVGKLDMGMSEWHEIELTVRDYELDQYGVVNNGVYSNYCQIAHYSLLQTLGVTTYANDNGVGLALSELSLKFKSPLKSGDRFLLRVRISGCTSARLTFHDAIIKLPNQQLILEANAIGVWLDKNMRPTRAPQEVCSVINQFIAGTESQQDDICDIGGRNTLI